MLGLCEHTTHLFDEPQQHGVERVLLQPGVQLRARNALQHILSTHLRGLLILIVIQSIGAKAAWRVEAWVEGVWRVEVWCFSRKVVRCQRPCCGRWR